MGAMRPAPNLIASSPGTPPSIWRASNQLEQLPRISREELLSPARRLVVVAPHPDDEVLGCGGLLASLGGDTNSVVLVSVTDGEASHPDSWTPEALRQTRISESRTALARLAPRFAQWEWHRLHLPDGAVQVAELCDRLRPLLRPGDRLLSTWRQDGHCDHEQVGLACAQLAAECGAQHCEVPIWAWHWAYPGDPRLPWTSAHRLDLSDEALRRKRAAIEAHASQLQGPAPVLSSRLLQTLLQPFEVYFL